MSRLFQLLISLAAVLIVLIPVHLATAQPTPTPTPINLPSGYDWKYNPANGHYYTFVNKPKTWHEAKLFSENVGGYLFTVTSEIEEKWIIDTFKSIFSLDVWMGLGGNPRGWVTNEPYGGPFDYTNWYETEKYSEPNNPTDPCFMYIGSSYLGKWYDENLNRQYPFIIEFHIGSLPTPTPVIIPTPTPIITPTPTPTPELWSSLNGTTLEENHLWADAPGGFAKGKIQVGEIPTGPGSDGKGLEVKLAPGQGAWILSDQVFEMESLAHITGSFRSSNKNGAVALVALNSPIDGQFGYTNIVSEEIPVDDFRQFQLIYGPPSGKMQIAIQAVNYAYSSVSTTVWIDNLNVVPFNPVVKGEAVQLQVNGNFEGGLENLVTNVNDQDGNIVPFFESLTDIALRLSIEPQHTAANIGTFCEGIYGNFPMRLLGQVSVQRDSLPGGGMLGFVITNGFQNLGVFRFADQIPDRNAPKPENLIIGGDFTVNNPDIPISTFVQIGGPGADVSVVVDDLMVFKNSPYENLPTPTQTAIPSTPSAIPSTPTPIMTPTMTPTPTAVQFTGETITISLPNLPADAKPLEMVLIPAGTFMMGSPESDLLREGAEWPQHQVTLSNPFYLSKYEVTQAQWQAVMGNNPVKDYGVLTGNEKGVGNNSPVYCVTWNECQAFIQKINRLNQGTFLLPTEAEWEYACRAGTTTVFYWGDDPNHTDYTQTENDYAWYNGGPPHEVGLKIPNAWGLFDMSGNVSEFCQDWYEDYYYTNEAQTDPQGPSTGTMRVTRGGAATVELQRCRSAARSARSPDDYPNTSIGLRLQRWYP